MSADVYRVFAVRYAHHDRQSPENFLFGDPHDILQPLAYFVWAITGDRGTFVVDTGFDQTMAERRGRRIVQPVDRGLAAIGVQSASVEHVIVTHLHYDHCGNHDLFPRAQYHLQDDEMAYATGRSMRHKLLRIPFEGDDVVAMVRKVFADRVTFHDGDWEMAPGITVHRIGGHSKGLQCVRVRTQRGWVVLAADASHLYAHLNEARVFPVTYNVGDVLEGYDTLRRLAESPNHIIPGHDPEVIRRYPAAGAGLEGLAVRLDEHPSP